MNPRDAAWWHALHAAVGLAGGFVFGVAAWGEHRVPALALALPLLVASGRSRLQASCIAAGYALGTLRYSASFIASWFHDRWVVGWAGMLACAFVTGCVWALGWSGSSRLVARAGALATAWVLALLAGIAIPGHPVIGAGYLLPGAGWGGVVAALALPVLALLAATAIPRLVARGAALAGLLATLGVAGVWLDAAPPPLTVAGIEAQRTRWGPLRGQDEALQRLQRMGATVPAQATASVVWPESIIGRYDPAFYPVLEIELLGAARRAGRTQIVGMDLPQAGGRLLNAAVAFYPDGRTATAIARQPAPVSLWKPWRSRDTFVANWGAHNMLAMGQGDRAAVIFCFEEYVPLFYLLNEALDAPTAYVALTNTWAARSQAAATIQTWHSLGMARLFGRPYVKAENRPAD